MASTLTTRQRAILRYVVEEYVATGQPVGSKTLAEQSGLVVSSSTVRSEFAELERGGYLMPSQRDDCLFCDIVRAGAYINKAKGFVAINDINPQAKVHLLIIPERHVDTFRDVSDFPAKESKRMALLVAQTRVESGVHSALEVLYGGLLGALTSLVLFQLFG